MARPMPKQRSGFGSMDISELRGKDLESPRPVLGMMPIGPAGGPVTKLIGNAAEKMVENPSTYSESAKGVMITADRAAREVAKHGLDPADFFREVGRGSHYMASKVLDWLGY